MGIKLKRADTAAVKHDASAHHPARPCYKNSHLPFENPMCDLLTWRNAVLPPIIDWVGTIEDPFTVNSHPDLQEVVKYLWSEEFPEIQADDPFQSVVHKATCFFTSYYSYPI